MLARLMPTVLNKVSTVLKFNGLFLSLSLVMSWFTLEQEIFFSENGDISV